MAPAPMSRCPTELRLPGDRGLRQLCPTDYTKLSFTTGRWELREVDSWVGVLPDRRNRADRRTELSEGGRRLLGLLVLPNLVFELPQKPVCERLLLARFTRGGIEAFV
jgi:hypothetical protein